MSLIAASLTFLAAFLVSLVGTWTARRTARRLGLMDAPGERKVHTTPTPRNGGIGIFWGITLPMLAVIVGAYALSGDLAWVQDPWWRKSIKDAAGGLRMHTPLALLLLACMAAIHAIGLLDDRKAMRPWPKLLAQLAAAAALVGIGEWFGPGSFRTLTLLDAKFPGGLLLSAVLSVLWIVALTNAFNFLDNMDGLSAGVAFLCTLIFLVAASMSGQWFICGLLLVFMGAVGGFLVFNFPPASIFMGDGGSMVLGFFLSALTIRTTYYGIAGQHHWYTLLMPLIILAVPLYDLLLVSVLRIAAGQSPMTGDTNHFSHRLTRHGFSKRGAVLVIYAVTLATGLSAPLLALVRDQVGAILIGLQTLAMLIVIGILERVGEHTAWKSGGIEPRRHGDTEQKMVNSD